MKKIKATLRTRNLKPVDQAYFICEHLEGEANNEIRVSNMCTDQEQIFTFLEELYGCPKSYLQ